MKRKYIRNLSKETLRKAIEDSENFTQALKKLGFTDGAMTSLRLAAEEYEIDIHHLKSQDSLSALMAAKQNQQKRLVHLRMNRNKTISYERKNNINREKYILEDSRKNDRKKNLENNLTKSFIANVIADGCSYCNEFEIKITLDRIDNSVGHLRTNVVASCVRCNYIKGNMPHEAWINLVPAIKNTKEQGLFGDWSPWPG